MTDSIVIRAYEPEDVPAATALFNQRSFAADTLQIPYGSVAERQDSYSSSPTLRMLVAEIDGKIVGHASLNLYTRRRSHVGSIGVGVDESFRGRGVGTAFMVALLDLADNWYNLRRVELQVYIDNAPAIHLYQKFGFTIEGTHRAFAYRDGAYVDALTMARVRTDLTTGGAGGEER